MTPENIEINAKLLFEFLGIEHCSDPKHIDDPCYFYMGEYVVAKQSKFHEDYGWLMPVVEKICSIEFDDGNDNYRFRTFGSKQTDTNQFMFRINNHILCSSDKFIEGLYLSVVDFCECHLKYEIK